MASEIRACWLWYETNSTSQAVVAKISLVIEYESQNVTKILSEWGIFTWLHV